MNERIKELYDQCWFGDDTAVYQKDLSIDTSMGYCFDTEKFAELIVRECIDICKEQEYKYWRSSEEDHWTPIDSANAIEKHFGVEE